MFRKPLIILYWLLISSTCLANEQLSFGTGEKFPMAPVASAILKSAYQKLGIQVTVKRYPIRRSIMLANQGETDGELFRGRLNDGEYPNLIKIPVSLAEGRLMVFIKDEDIRVERWEDLTAYNVGSHPNLNAVNKHQNEFKTFQAHSNIDQLFNMLERGRLDVLILPFLVGKRDLKRLKQPNINMLPVPLEINELYHYLNIKHQALAPKITQVLQEMNDSNELDAIRKKLKDMY